MKEGLKKKGVSLMISYVILISIAIGLSVVVYSWLSAYTDPGSKIDCKDGTSLYLDDYKYILVNGVINLTLKNNGYFNISGFVARASNSTERAPIELLNATGEGEGFSDGNYYFFPALSPGQIRNANFLADNVQVIEIQPFILDKNGNKIMCEQSVIRQNIQDTFDLYSWGGLISYWDFEEADGSVAGDSFGTNDGLIYGNTKLLMRFDEGSGNPKDNSSYDNDGTITGATWTAAGKSGNALSFDGVNDYVTIGDDPSLRFTSASDVSIELWAKLNNDPGWIIHNYDGITPNYWQIELRGDGTIWSQWRTSTANYLRATGKTDLTKVIDWHHIVVVYNGTAKKGSLYIDGVFENSSNNSLVNGNFYNTNNIEIGRYSSEYVNGTIDEVAVYSKALSQTEITEHFIAGRAKFTERVSGQSGNALQFDGIDDYTRIPHSSSLEPDSITISFWFNADSLNDLDTFISKGDSDNIPSKYIIMFYLNMIRYAHVTNAGETHGFNSGAGLVNTGEWNHLAFVYTFGSASTAKMYINGQDANGVWDSGKGDVAPPLTTFDITIGAGNGGTGRYFDGSIDDALIFNRTLSPEEISEIYCNQGRTC